MKEVNIIIPEDLVTINRIEYDFLLNERQRNKELKQRIDKAMNYIVQDLIPYGNEYHWDNLSLEDEVAEVLNILRGE